MGGETEEEREREREPKRRGKNDMRTEIQMKEKHVAAAAEKKQSMTTEEVQAMCLGRFKSTAALNSTIRIFTMLSCLFCLPECLKKSNE